MRACWRWRAKRCSAPSPSASPSPARCGSILPGVELELVCGWVGGGVGGGLNLGMFRQVFCTEPFCIPLARGRRGSAAVVAVDVGVGCYFWKYVGGSAGHAARCSKHPQFAPPPPPICAPGLHLMLRQDWHNHPRSQHGTHPNKKHQQSASLAPINPPPPTPLRRSPHAASTKPAPSLATTWCWRGWRGRQGATASR